MRKHLRLTITALALSLVQCTDSIYEGLQTARPAEEATKALERQNPQQAVNIVLAALGTQYRALYFKIDAAIENGTTEDLRTELEALTTGLITTDQIRDVPSLVSILSSAHAKIYGIDPLDLALALARDDSGEEDSSAASLNLAESSANDLAALFPVLPEATEENINGLTGARLILDSIGADYFTSADHFKKGLYLTANVSMISKQLDTDGDGKVSVIESITLTAANAQSVLDLLSDASRSVSSAGEETSGANAANSADKISGIREKILTSEGADDTERVRNYLSGQSS